MKNILFVLATALVLSLGACETMKGLGEDIETAGKAIKKKASE
jgi:predicted small secreted protein